MNANEIRTLVDYNYWANARLLDAVASCTPDQYTQQIESSFKSVRETLVHLYGAERIWTDRLYLEAPAGFPPPESFPTLESVRDAWMDVEVRLRAFASSLEESGVNRVLGYKTLSFGPMASSVAQIVQHLVNHGTYHRGQVTTMLRQVGAVAPKSMDLIFYYREKAQG